MAAPRISRQSLKWLFLEGAAIVFSILLAFWIDAWWHAHSDQALLEEYLSQVRADTLENQHRLIEALELERAQQGAVSEILVALRSPAPMTLDSARQWIRVEPGFPWYSDPRLLDGAIAALVSTGDINLVRDPRLKTSLINYLGQLKADLNEFDRGVDHFLTHEAELLRVLEMARAPGTESGQDALANELLAIQNDRTAAAVLRLLEKNIGSRIWYLEQMLTVTKELSSQLTPWSARP
jgi:hypothetical protein